MKEETLELPRTRPHLGCGELLLPGFEALHRAVGDAALLPDRHDNCRVQPSVELLVQPRQRLRQVADLFKEIQRPLAFPRGAGEDDEIVMELGKVRVETKVFLRRHACWQRHTCSTLSHGGDHQDEVAKG